VSLLRKLVAASLPVPSGDCKFSITLAAKIGQRERLAPEARKQQPSHFCPAKGGTPVPAVDGPNGTQLARASVMRFAGLELRQ